MTLKWFERFLFRVFILESAFLYVIAIGELHLKIAPYLGSVLNVLYLCKAFVEIHR